jgi:hypothetical protein
VDRLTRVTFIPNPRFEQEFAASEEARRILEPLGPELEAGASSRVRYRLGHLERSIEYEVGRDDDGLYRGRLNAHDFKAAWHEFGTSRIPPDGALRATVEDVVGPVTGGDK